MGDTFYRLICGLGRPLLWVSSSPVVLHRERVPLKGAFILASNHFSPYDIPCLLYATPRKLDFLSVVEFWRSPFWGWFFTHFNALPLDRSKPDAPTVRAIYDRLEKGRVVSLFPEGGVKKVETSVITGGPVKPGFMRMARTANVPIVPCVVLGTEKFTRFTSWFPIKRTRWGVAFGEPVFPGGEHEPIEIMLGRLKTSYESLYQELRVHVPELRL